MPTNQRRWATPTGEPCPRVKRLDGTIEGSGDCVGCGFCLLLLAAAYGETVVDQEWSVFM
jgi:hypothetical protein